MKESPSLKWERCYPRFIAAVFFAFLSTWSSWVFVASNLVSGIEWVATLFQFNDHVSLWPWFLQQLVFIYNEKARQRDFPLFYKKYPHRRDQRNAYLWETTLAAIALMTVSVLAWLVSGYVLLKSVLFWSCAAWLAASAWRQKEIIRILEDMEHYLREPVIMRERIRHSVSSYDE